MLLLHRRVEARRRSQFNRSASLFSKRCSSLPQGPSARRRAAPPLQARRVASITCASDSSPTTSAAVAAPPPPSLLPATYRRLIARVPSPSFRSGAQVQELPLPSPDALDEGQVLVRIAVAGVNGGCETFRVRAEPGTPFEKKKKSSNSGGSSSSSSSSASPDDGDDDDSFLVPLGAEGAGTVVAVGPGVRPSQLRVGDRVVVNGGSAFAEYVFSPSRGCFKVPSSSGNDPSSSLSPAQAVALSLSGLTAAVALHATAKVKPGETVLVTAAAGGTGHLAVQLAALVPRCRVVAVAGGALKCRRLRRELARLDPKGERGHAVIDYKSLGESSSSSGDLSLAISQALAAGGRGGGVDVCYEGVGGLVRRAVFQNLSPGARVLCVGYMASYPHTENYHRQQGRGGEGEGAATEAAAEAAAATAETVFVSAPFGAGPSGEAALPLEPDLFWNRRVVPLPGDRTVVGDVWAGAAGDPRVLARLRRDLFASALRGELVPWIDGEEGEEEEEENGDPPSPSFSGLEAAADAVERLLSGASMGKVVLRVSEGGAW